MKLDLIVSNPPYNNDIYIDFVERAEKFINDTGQMLFITPGKWYLKRGKRNEYFRECVVPHISEVVYYFDSQDVFDISLNGGITYYLIDKNIHEEKYVTSFCEKARWFENDRRLVKFDNGIFLLSDLCKGICDKVGCFNKDFKAFIPKWETEHKGINLFVTTVASISGGRTFSNDGNLFMVSTVNKSEENRYKSQDYGCIFSASCSEEADNFISWINTKFIRFMLVLRWHSYHINNMETWQFVPMPDAFNHKFCDKEFYEQYGLTNDEIEVIESVIKER